MIAVAKTYRTKTALAEAFDTSKVSIDNWTRKADFPGGRNGPWNHAAVEKYLLAHGSPIPGNKRNERQGAAGQASAGSAKTAAEALRTREQYRRLKLQNDLLEGKLVLADEVRQASAEMLLRIKHRLESLPDELAMTFPESTRPQNVADFRNQIYLVLKEMSQWKPLATDQ